MYRLITDMSRAAHVTLFLVFMPSPTMGGIMWVREGFVAYSPAFGRQKPIKSM